MLSRGEAQDAVGGHGWRFLLGTLRTSVRVGSLTDAVALAARAVETCGDDADGHLHTDLRPERVEFVLQTREFAALTARDVELAQRITAMVGGLGLRTEGAIDTAVRSVQELEIAIDAIDIAAIRPFWKAVLGYADDLPGAGPTAPIVDPVRQGPAVWFQQMTSPRRQRNRVHFDLCVPHDEAPARIAAALVAGGRLLSDRRSPAFWILADVEGNEICVTTWQGRD
ncbi:VOC family protein [Actinoplanes sp. OR16]|uniref:VOC family protein n=1 Tax=Actinoplanes sp. OR16 TaxID=946334 RepID=UPI000FD72BFF|nr:VOC family protein [Actinoplanes sp. OR16]